jgi:hypothetical protein
MSSGIAGVIFLGLAASQASAREPVPLLNHLNDIDSVRCESAGVHFIGQDGTISFQRENSTWTIDSTRKYTYPSLDDEHYWDQRIDSLSVWFDKNFSLATYSTVQRSATHDSTVMLLVANAGEGAVRDEQCVFDKGPRVTYCFPHNRTKVFDFDRNSIWLGSFRGMTRLERDSGKRTDYVLLPLLDESSSAYLDSIHLWIAADGIGIQRIDLRTKLITFWSIDDLLNDLHQRWKAHNHTYERPRGTATFTNWEPDGDDLFVGCRFVGGAGSLIKRSSYLLTFSRPKQTWHAEWIFRTEHNVEHDVDGISVIRRFGRVLWMGCGHREVWEGGGHNDFGGLFAGWLNIRYPDPRFGHGPLAHPDNRIDGIGDADEVHRKHLVVAMTIDDDKMFVETYVPEPGRRTVYKIDKNAQVTVVSDSLGAFYDEYYQRIRQQSYRGPRALPESLLRVRVPPVIRTVPADSVEVNSVEMTFR